MTYICVFLHTLIFTNLIYGPLIIPTNIYLFKKIVWNMFIINNKDIKSNSFDIVLVSLWLALNKFSFLLLVYLLVTLSRSLYTGNE